MCTGPIYVTPTNSVVQCNYEKPACRQQALQGCYCYRFKSFDFIVYYVNFLLLIVRIPVIRLVWLDFNVNY